MDFDFSNTPLLGIYTQLKNHLNTQERVSFKVVNPDNFSSTYNGTIVKVAKGEALYRGYKTWVDLAHTLGCKMLTPVVIDDDFILVKLQKLQVESFHSVDASKEEKYGVDSIFAHIHKNEEFAFLHAYTQALHNVNLPTRKRILNLGINSGDEFELIKKVSENFSTYELVGIDYCHSAIQHARQKFQNDKNITFYAHDINKLSSLELGRFDLLISIGTLQSTTLSFQKVLMDMVQNHLYKEGSIILGFPNCRWIDGEMIYGAKMRNYNFSEMSNLYKDVNFAKKYLQQKKFRVTITGKDYIFITATSIR